MESKQTFDLFSTVASHVDSYSRRNAATNMLVAPSWLMVMVHYSFQRETIAFTLLVADTLTDDE